jgi:hypothetical protein
MNTHRLSNRKYQKKLNTFRQTQHSGQQSLTSDRLCPPATAPDVFTTVRQHRINYRSTYGKVSRVISFF